MAEITLNPDIAQLATDEKLAARKRIYETLYDGMKKANEGTPPDYSQPPYSIAQKDSEGNVLIWEAPDGTKYPLTEPNQQAIEDKMAEISLIQMKNAAYLFASVIDAAVISGATGVDMTAFVQKSGDIMTGSFTAQHGFSAGCNGTKVMDIYQTLDEDLITHIYGSLIVDKNVRVIGSLELGSDGISFAGQKSIYYKDGALAIDSLAIDITGKVNIQGSLNLGDLTIDDKGIYLNGKEYYHNGNSNLPSVDWSMKDAYIHGDLIISGKSQLKGRLIALSGFDLGEKDNVMLSSGFDDLSQKHWINITTDLNLNSNNSVMCDNERIIYVRKGNFSKLSLSAPGMVLNLGDSNGDDENRIPTKYISLQADIYDSSNSNKLIGHDGSGNFPNGFSAGVANAGNWAMRTYTHSLNDYGVVFQKMIALGGEYGPKLCSENNDESIQFSIPHSLSTETGINVQRFNLDLYFGESNSIWHDQTKQDVSLHFGGSGELCVFDIPVEAKTFSINSLTHKTQLKENALFLREGIFIEGVEDGMSIVGNTYFNGNLQSPRFASGFAGYGWGIIKNEFAGGYHATFDELTVRKRMRIYEFDVQNDKAQNGSLWISDSCSGDQVEEIFEKD